MTHEAEYGPRGGWLKPAALAATVLLSLSVVLNILVDSPDRFEQVGARQPVTGPAVQPGRETASPAAGEELGNPPDTAVADDRGQALSIVAEYVVTEAGRAPAAEREDPEAMLREIARLHAAGERARSGALLDEFLALYPDHPVSLRITGRSD